MIDAGYFPKRIEKAPIAYLKAPVVREICSASGCISKGPKDWLTHWKHNDLGLFNKISDALSVIPAESVSDYRLFAYRLHEERLQEDNWLGVTVPPDVRPDPISKEFLEVGFDVCNIIANVQGIGCSPLSCNSLASEIDTNEACLFSSLQAARAGAKQFRKLGAEPGDYLVIQVLERERKAA